MDPPNVLWSFGAFTLGFAVYELIETMPPSQSGLWILLTALGLIAGFAAGAAVLLRRGSWVPGGLAAALAVSVFPAVAVAFLELVGVWPGDSVLEPLQGFNGYAFGVAVACTLVGLGAWWLTRFPFVLAVACGAVLVSAQLLTPSFAESPSGDARTATAVVAGAVLFVVGVVVDGFARRREAFWFEVLGLFSVAAGLVYFTVEPGGDTLRGWIPMLLGGAFLLVASAPAGRASWAVYGVFGTYAAVVHFLVEKLNERRWPFALALIALALAIVALGMAQQRYGRNRNGSSGTSLAPATRRRRR